MRYVWRKDLGVIPAHLAPREPPKRSGLPAPYVRPDGMSDTWNPANGKYYDSRSGYERAVKDAGCVIAGDDSSLSRPPKIEEVGGIEQDIKDAYEQLSSR